jgi:hypothetical protein
MENNKFLYVIFTICVVILVLLIVQMCILIPMAIHGGQGHMHHYPMMSAAPAQAQAPAQFHGPCPMFKCKPMMPHKHPFPQPGFKDGHNFGDQKPGDKPMPGQPGPKPGPKAPAEPQKSK